jgi:dienelactone hydrolase
VAVLRTLALLLALVTLAGCGASSTPGPQRTTTTTAAPMPGFEYDRSAQLEYVDRGGVGRLPGGVTVHDVSFRSQRLRIDGYLLLPTDGGRHPAVVVVHGSGGDRRELLSQAGRLAARGFVALTLTEPSTTQRLTPRATPLALLRELRMVQIRDVVTIRRAVDVLQSLPQVEPKLIGYLGWSAGGRNGTFVAATEPRVKALVLLSTGSAPLSAFVAQSAAEAARARAPDSRHRRPAPRDRSRAPRHDPPGGRHA